MSRNQVAAQLSYHFPDLTPEKRPDAEQVFAGIVSRRVEAHNATPTVAPVKLTGFRWHEDNQRLTIRFGSQALADLQAFAEDFQSALRELGDQLTVRLEHVAGHIVPHARSVDSDSPNGPAVSG